MDIYNEKINENLSLFQKKGSLAFGTDAYLLYAYMRSCKEKACELGAGSGVISLLCASSGKMRDIDAFELQDDIFAVAAKNVEENGLSGKVRILHSDIRDIPAEYNGRYSVVFSNPPYLKADSGKANENAADRISRRELHGSIYDFFACASPLLRFGGLFCAVYRPDRLGDLICAMRENSLEPKRLTLVYPTVSHVPCLVLIEGKKGAAAGVFTTRPLIIYKSINDMTQANYTDEMKYIYENGDFHEFYKKP